MATYAIGDIHGCYETLRRLLDRVEFDPTTDRVWLVGDLVNRGPSSLRVLRWAMEMEDAVVAILGNHEIHLLAQALRINGAKPRSALKPVLKAPDAQEIVDWVRHCPLVHREGSWMMVHAGVLPSWKPSQVEEMARDAEAALRGPEGEKLLEASRKAAARVWSADQARKLRRAAFVRAVTGVRMVDESGQAVAGFTGRPDELANGFSPWFSAPSRRTRKLSMIFGHWAMLGLYRGEGCFGLDSGCVWGGSLTALRLDDEKLFSEPMADE